LKKNRELRQEIKKSQYQYRDLLENANDFIFTLDNAGNFTYLNNRFTPMTAWEKEAWIKKPFLDLIDQEDRDLANKYYEMAHQGRARVFEARIRTNTANVEPVLSFNITPILEKGAIFGSIGIGRDVTEQKKMEREILDLKNFNESIIQSMEAGLLTTDLNSYVTYLNAGAERILGWKLNEVVGKKLSAVLKPEEATTLLSTPPPPGSLPYSRESVLTVKDGSKISIGFTTTDRVDNSRSKVGSIVSFRDITELKRMQSEVLRMDRLASLGVLASGIAHEIKNPLAGIKAMAQACEEEFETEDPRKEYLVRIVRQVNRLDDLLKTFFAYARPKPPKRKKHKLSAILVEVMSLVKKKLASHNIEYKEIFEPNLPEVLVDPQQIQQVFINLILNSLDAMSEGGTLTVQTRKAENLQPGIICDAGRKKPDTNGSYVEVIVDDSGSGIHSENLQTIFDPFYTTKSSGLGLGLSIVYRIIEDHEGDILVKSQIDEGTQITIVLPTGE
jgi:PAS domain S-box-containing protein